MPFENCSPRAFNTNTVQRNAPAASGVYGLSSAQEWIYIGETDNIKASLLGHLAERDTLIARRRPSGFTFELSPSYNRTARKDRLVVELSPACEDHFEKR
ncbi:MAG: hypothetical protein ABIZ80_05890 [Bryobacteraceae bacterium]